MEAGPLEERQKAHALIDKLSVEQLEAVSNLLEVMVTRSSVRSNRLPSKTTASPLKLLGPSTARGPRSTAAN